jgi:hypothetical protein
MLSTHLRLGLPSDPFLSGLPTNNLYSREGFALAVIYRLLDAREQITFSVSCKVTAEVHIQVELRV